MSGLRSTKLLTAYTSFLLVVGCQFGYVVEQGWQQLSFQAEQVALSEVGEEHELSEEAREKLAWVPRVLQFCEEELGLDPGDSYTTFLDTQGQPISYVVTAAHPLGLVPYQWHFPFAGTVAYKGYFERADAERERDRLKTTGYDTALSAVGAYSTLGWFRDPVLSTMLRYNLAHFIDLLIHETVHRTIYFPGDTSFNESLATHIAQDGTLRFLEQHPKLRDLIPRFRAGKRSDRQFEELMFRFHSELETLYRSGLSDEAKLTAKTRLFETVSNARRVLSRSPDSAPLPVSNAIVLNFSRYHQYVEFFRDLQTALGGDPSRLTAYLRDAVSNGRQPSEIMNAASELFRASAVRHQIRAKKESPI